MFNFLYILVSDFIVIFTFDHRIVSALIGTVKRSLLSGIMEYHTQVEQFCTQILIMALVWFALN